MTIQLLHFTIYTWGLILIGEIDPRNFVTPSMNSFISARCWVQSSTFVFLSLSQGEEGEYKNALGGSGFLHDKF